MPRHTKVPRATHLRAATHLPSDPLECAAKYCHVTPGNRIILYAFQFPLLRIVRLSKKYGNTANYLSSSA